MSTIEKWTKFAGTQAGRDRIYRFLQYLARYVAARSSDKEQIERFQKLSAALGLSRRLFRAGKPIEDINSAIKTLNSSQLVTPLKIATSLRHFLFALWLSVDTFQWLVGIGFIKYSDTKKLDRKAAQFWFSSLIISNFINFYKYLILNKKDNAVMIDIVKDGLDLILPGSILEIFPVETGRVGIVGAITSLIQAYQLWP